MLKQSFRYVESGRVNNTSTVSILRLISALKNVTELPRQKFIINKNIYLLYDFYIN